MPACWSRGSASGWASAMFSAAPRLRRASRMCRTGRNGSDRFVFEGGNLGSDTVVELVGAPGRDKLDFSLFDGTVTLDLRKSTPQVVDPVHLTLTLQTGAAIEDFDGSQHDDMLYGNDQDNVINGLGGNDIIFGGYGNDTLSGGEGNDIVLGDEGMVTKNADGSVTVTLLDVGTVTGDHLLGPVNALSSALLSDALVLVTGTKNVWGYWDTHVLDVSLMAAGNDVITGDAGDDLIFGPGGNDTLSGGDGNDYIEGNEGDDLIHGDAGNDILIGDNSYHFAPTNENLPTVFHAYGLGRGFECALASVVVPLVADVPHGVHRSEEHTSELQSHSD